MTDFIPRLMWSALLLAGLIVAGTVGYLVMEGQTLGDSLYMTVITLTAVGYEEVWQLSPSGRVFTMFLLLGGITWLGFWFASLTSLIVELDLQGAMRRRRHMKQIAQLKDHVIICGAGRTGRQIAQELVAAGHDFVVIEKSPARIDELHDYVLDPHVIEGDATHDQVLLEAGLASAKGLITSLSADTDNLFVCLSARDLAHKVTIVARAYEEETIDKLYRAGADHVVSPNVSSAVRMASVLLRPSVVSFMEVATLSSQHIRLDQATIPDGSSIAGRTLAEARIPEETGLLVIAVRKEGEKGPDFAFNPSAETRLSVGDELIVLGEAAELSKLRAYVS